MRDASLNTTDAISFSLFLLRAGTCPTIRWMKQVHLRGWAKSSAELSVGKGVLRRDLASKALLLIPLGP
jgi:hypothetical protein